MINIYGAPGTMAEELNTQDGMKHEINPDIANVWKIFTDAIDKAGWTITPPKEPIPESEK